MVEQPPRRPQRTAQDCEVAVEVLLTDVLRHADRGDRVELFASEPAVVLEADLDPPVSDPDLCHPLLGRQRPALR